MTKSIVVALDPRHRHRKILVKTHQHVEVSIPLQKTLAGEYGVRIVLCGKGASASIRGGGVFSGSQNVKLTMDTVHEAPNTRGSTLIRAAVKDKASFNFSGTIKIAKRAQRSEDFLQQDSLLLSERAYATSVPALEIEADDVKASHAATVAPVDREQVFYLRSRGISEKMAESMLARAFLAPIMRGSGRYV